MIDSASKKSAGKGSGDNKLKKTCNVYTIIKLDPGKDKTHQSNRKNGDPEDNSYFSSYENQDENNKLSFLDQIMMFKKI